MDLYVAEKPSLGKGFADQIGRITKTDKSYLEIDGGRAIVTWCFGHIFELELPDYYLGEKRPWSFNDLPIFPAKYKKRCTNTAQFRVISGFAKKATRIINAGDPDFEGQLLVDEVFVEAGIDPYGNNVLRLSLAALDPDSVKKALSKLEPNAKHRNNRFAAEGRSIADWVYGNNSSRAASISAGVTCHIGRVKTPTLGMVVKRDLEIESFVSKDFFVPWVVLGDQKFTFKESVKDYGVTDEEGRILNEDFAKKVSAFCKSAPFKVIVSESEVKSVSPPLPHSLDSLQSLINKTHGYSAQEVLDIAQSLYETHKIATYPRTDSRYLPKSMLADRQKVLGAIYADYREEVSGCRAEVVSKCFNDSKVTAHHAIIPTGKKPEISKLSESEKVVFDAICRYYIIQMYPNAKVQHDKVVIRYGELFDFSASESAVLDAQWKKVVGKLEPSEEK